MKKKLSIIITALILSILAAGCSVEIHEDSGKQDAKYYLYDISSDETQLQKESYSPEETTADYMLKDMMQRMNSQQTDSQNRVSLLPEGVQMNYSVEEDVLVVNFNSQYSSMSRARELLVRAGVVKTFLQVPGINSVRFTIENEDLTDSRQMIGVFQSSRNRNTLGNYLKTNAWEDDTEGETRIYLVKDSEHRPVVFFSLKCGLLFRSSSYDKLEESERDFVDMVVNAKKLDDQETVNSYYEYGSQEFRNIDALFQIANKRVDAKNEIKELKDGKHTLRVDSCFSGIELKHFCKNEMYIPDEHLDFPLGFGIFWEVIVPRILEITEHIGCKYLYLFAADHTEQADIKKLVYYYKSSLKFYECDDDIMLIKPEYDENCYGLVQEIAKLRENREAVWQEYSDISGHY